MPCMALLRELAPFDRSIGSKMLHVTSPRSFAILRCTKIRTMGNMGTSLKLTFQKCDTPNADARPDITVLVGGETSRAVLGAWKERAPHNSDDHPPGRTRQTERPRHHR